jgi:hypothetical protein
MEYKCGRMVQGMKECGRGERLQGRESSHMSMEIPMRGSGKMIRPMGMGCVYTRRVGRGTRGIGNVICSTVQVYNSTSMVTNSRVCSNKVKKMVKAPTTTTTAQYTVENG